MKSKEIPSTIQAQADRFKTLLTAVNEGEKLYIVAGLANRPFYEQVEGAIRHTYEEKGVQANIIAGPILSVDEHGDSPLLRLARGDNPSAILYASSFRSREHYRIIGNQTIQVENRHMPLQEDRRMMEYNDAYSMAIYINYFKAAVSLFCKRWSRDYQDLFIRIGDNDIKEILSDFDYDFKTTREIRNHLGQALLD
ncbi:MAG: hypothetical protein PHQ59_01215 [Candidatus Daviesbacteria bacterium]|nr:hypothetical protein [Candidatus Daviesbacteria bacterium]